MSNLQSLANGTQVQSGSASFVVQTSEVPTPEPGVRVRTFESGKSGDRALGSDAFSSGGEYSFYTNTQSYSGSQSARCDTVLGKANSNYFGGWLTIPNNVYKGQEIWFQIKVKFDSDFIAGGATQDTTKFMRFTTSNVGHVDIYMRRTGSATSYSFVSEVTDPAQQSVKFGNTTNDPITLGEWSVYEFYMKSDNIPVDEGGSGIARFWKDGRLLGEFTNLRTLRSADAYVSGCILFTYWNGANGVDIPPQQGCWVDDIIIQTSQPSKNDSQGNPMIGV